MNYLLKCAWIELKKIFQYVFSSNQKGLKSRKSYSSEMFFFKLILYVSCSINLFYFILIKYVTYIGNI